MIYISCYVSHLLDNDTPYTYVIFGLNQHFFFNATEVVSLSPLF